LSKFFSLKKLSAATAIAAAAAANCTMQLLQPQVDIVCLYRRTVVGVASLEFHCSLSPTNCHFDLLPASSDGDDVTDHVTTTAATVIAMRLGKVRKCIVLKVLTVIMHDNTI